jgi:hypothetical protein
MNRLSAENNILAFIVPPGVGGAVKNGINLSLKNVLHALIYCVVQKGADGTQTTWTLAQSSGNAGSASGTGEKAMTGNVPIYYSDSAAGSNLLAATTAAKAYEQAITQSVTQVVCFDITPELCMDLDNGFDCIVVNSSDPGAANIAFAFALLEPRYTPALTAYTD